ncbi:hypothetical protein BJ165DRAFT_1412495 [Panaeolus papilionaceus]|nr:hypothetical protein BJ165DRAFT_1412495 [Panaeolus papilionaceus]
MTLPDPTQYPDPYPFRSQSSLPALSSAGSSSTRSSAYTSSAASALAYNDYAHYQNHNVHVASPEDDPIANALGIISTKDITSQTIMATDTARPKLVGHRPSESARRSDTYSASLRSRSSSLGNGINFHDSDSPPPPLPLPLPLSQKPSYDQTWQPPQEKDESLISEDETDDEHGLDLLDRDDDNEHDLDDERTAAVAVAEDGQGLIVHGDNIPIVQLHAQPGTTHLLIGSSPTPNHVPQFLSTCLPQIAHSLLVLDISANFVAALPPVLAMCENLEELNVASNPLRVLPVFLAHLYNLRVLIADSTSITTLPDALVDLVKLHTISIRRNKLHSLPSWLCLLPALQTLCVDGNPFQGPWKALVDPLLAKVPSTPMYPPSTPMTMPLMSAGAQSSNADGETDGGATTDLDEFSDHEDSAVGEFSPKGFAVSHDEEEHTITPDRAAPPLSRSTTSPLPASSFGHPLRQTAQQSPQHYESPEDLTKPLTRTRTTPNRTYFDQNRAKSTVVNGSDSRPLRQVSASGSPDDHNTGGPQELRKMKSAGDLRRGRSLTPNPNAIPENEMPRITTSNFPPSRSSSNLLAMTPSPVQSSAAEAFAKRFASLGPATQLGSRSTPTTSRPQLSQSLWEGSPSPSTHQDDATTRSSSSGTNSPAPKFPVSRNEPIPMERVAASPGVSSASASTSSSRHQKSRWGFLKKMSMGKMKPEVPSPSNTFTSTPTSSPGASPDPRVRSHTTRRPHTSHGDKSALAAPTQFQTSISAEPSLKSTSPQLDLRFSNSPMMDSMPLVSVSSNSPPRLQIQTSVSTLDGPKPSSSTTNLLTAVPSPSPNSLLAPPTAPRAKRRSFLPIDAPGSMSLSIPENSAFVSIVVDADEPTATQANSVDARALTPSPVTPDHEQYMRREAERAREAYMRALRSVMAYLRDMNDLGTVQLQQQMAAQAHLQQQTVSIYGASSSSSGGAAGEDHAFAGARPRRMTVSDKERDIPVSPALPHLRSSDGTGTRSGTSSQTLSVATTDSVGSDEGRGVRTFKDDKGKRAMVIKEIVVTERTYVKGLQELVDIYIKPGSTPVNLLSGVSSKNETVVPASERKVVFNGVDSLFSFHKDSFLPALEVAAAPLLNTALDNPESDADGQLSLSVANAVGNIFVKHAAFMRMYSSYINNFDSSVQRVKYWTSDRNTPATPTPSSLSPSSSTSQLVGLGISMAMTSGAGNIAEAVNASSTGIPNLTTSQRRRIKQYLKRCRLNPRHTQLNLEGYLLLPVQRIPRYKLLLEELGRSTPPMSEFIDDPLDRALAEIALLANNMNEGKRESESRRKLVQWQARIRGKFPSPLVQPHRRLIMDGPLLLTRVVRKAVVNFESINAQGDACTVQVDCLAPELTPRKLIGILCNDLLVLCRDPSEGKDPNSVVDLWAVLRMQTLPQPASIVHGNALRLVDNKAILYFDAPSPSAALNWYRAINLHIPASKT